jgi:hypothetical protein
MLSLGWILSLDVLGQNKFHTCISSCSTSIVDSVATSKFIILFMAGHYMSFVDSSSKHIYVFNTINHNDTNQIGDYYYYYYYYPMHLLLDIIATDIYYRKH